MNTSSSDGGDRPHARRPRMPAPLERRRDRVATAVARVAVGSRTCARSPNACTSSTPGMRAQHVERRTRGGRRSTSNSCPGSARLQRRRRVERQQPALVQQRDARAPLGLVQVRRRHHDREALRQELRQQLPELAPRHRIDAGRRLVEQQDLAARGRACRPAPASASCRPTADRRGGARNGVSCVISSSRSRARAIVARRRGSRRRTRCSRRCVRSP